MKNKLRVLSVFLAAAAMMAVAGGCKKEEPVESVSVLSFVDEGSSSATASSGKKVTAGSKPSSKSSSSEESSSEASSSEDSSSELTNDFLTSSSELTNDFLVSSSSATGISGNVGNTTVDESIQNNKAAMEKSLVADLEMALTKIKYDPKDADTFKMYTDWVLKNDGDITPTQQDWESFRYINTGGSDNPENAAPAQNGQSGGQQQPGGNQQQTPTGGGQGGGGYSVGGVGGYNEQAAGLLKKLGIQPNPDGSITYNGVTSSRDEVNFSAKYGNSIPGEPLNYTPVYDGPTIYQDGPGEPVDWMN